MNRSTSIPDIIRLGSRLLLCAMVVIAAGCDLTEAGSDSSGEIVVEAYLQAGEDMGQVRLSRVASIEDRYDFTTVAVRGAQVEIRRIGEDGSIEEALVFAELPDRPGVYWILPRVKVLPLATYELFVLVPESGETVRSRTIVPGAFSVIEFGPETSQYQSTEQIEVLLTRSDYPGRPAIFVFSTESLDPRIDTLTPFYREVVDPDQDADDDELDDFLVNESPPLNESGYQIDEDGNLSIKVPWLAFAFYGPNELRTNAIDDNLYDFVRSQRVQQGGSTLAPGEIPNVLDHIDGGIGVFGSYASASVRVTVTRNAAP
ncbi:MAG: DUF4249 domain-containing protein [Rhodothermia bacterium]|nr:DUF4249 domain-containing protein [Rhodothermia bacterium]